MIPSKRQQAIFDTWNDTDNSIVIKAVAGSGKTTVLLQLLEMCKYKTLFVAFNKSIQEEIQEKITTRGLSQGKAMTIHGLGLAAIKYNYKRWKINNNKNFDIIKRIQEQEKKLFKKMSWEDKLKFSYTIMDMNDISRLFLTDDISEIKKHLESMDKMMFEHDQIDYLWQEFLTIREEYLNADTLEIDFNDMIYIPVLKSLTIPVDPAYLMIDECQDLNLAQHKLIQNLISQGSIQKWIAVGDPNQAIYGFSGAFSSSFDMFVQMSEKVVEMPLDICYRCDTRIVEMANKVYDVMVPFKSSAGIVNTMSDINLVKEKSMVICRNTKPLIELYFGLLSVGKPAFLKGEDIMTSIVRFLKPYGKLTVDAARREMEYKLIDLEQDSSEKGRIKIYFFKEDMDKFKKFVDYLATPGEIINDLLEDIKKLFVNKKDAIVLCTIHKSKGLEADIVYILEEGLIPSKFAKSPEQLKQEMNLKYVARTRAKNEMYFLNL